MKTLYEKAFIQKYTKHRISLKKHFFNGNSKYKFECKILTFL